MSTSSAAPHKRHARDFYVTPPSAVESIRPVVEEYKSSLIKPRPPARLVGMDAGCGTGALAPLLSGLYSVGVDTVPGCRFDAYQKILVDDFLRVDQPADLVVMNPPFSISVPFVSHARTLSRAVLALLPLNCLAPIKYEPVLGNDQAFDVFVLRKRPAFLGTGPKFECAWFFWHPEATNRIMRI